MYAVIEVSGTQWKVSKASTIRVPKIEKEPGKSIDIDKVLLLVDKDKVSIGKPVVSDVRVKATVLSHGKAGKIKVFKKKRRKDYKVLKGHRQQYTELRIDKISVEKEEKKAPALVKTATKKTTAAPSVKQAKNKETKTKEIKTTETKKRSTSAKKEEK